MALKRNVLTVLYTILFLAITGFGLFQMTNLAVSATSNKYLVAGILVFGLIIFLLVAFFAKEADVLRIIQSKSILLIIFELLLVLSCNGFTFYINWIQQGMFGATTLTLLLICLYLAARLCGGRLCGLLSLVSGFYLLLKFSSTDMIQIDSAVKMLCFLIPFIVFLTIQHVLIPAVGGNGFLVIASYLVLGFLFSLAIALNPIVFVLLAGCIFSLLFAVPQKDTYSILTKGVFCAAYLILFTAILLFCIHIFVPGVIQLSAYELDHGLPLAWSRDTFDYVTVKYTRPLIYLYLPFQYGIFPTIMLFFTVLAGYYTIRKKSSYMGPAILSFVAMFAFYILFCEGGSQFYYLTYFLPLFAAYGFSNTLIADEKPVAVSEPVDEEDLPSVKKESIEEEEVTKELAEEANPEEESDTIKSKESKVEKKDEVAPVPKNNEIPEWTIPDEFLPEKQDDYLLLDEDSISEESSADVVESFADTEDSVEDLITDPADDSLDLDQFVPETDENAMDYSEPEENLDELDTLTEENISSDNHSEQIVADANLQSNADGVLEVPTEEETQLNDLLDRLDMSEPIKRMNESAQEDLADVIEREEEQVELSEALPLKPSKSTLPKYKKPDFDFEIEPVNIPLDDQYSNISEYDEVPTIHDLENQWKSDSKPVIETVATEVDETEEENQEENTSFEEDLLNTVHSEEIVRKNGMNKRSYHKITIR